MFIHVIRPGDTLWELSVYYDVTPEAIAEINVVPNPYQIPVGQALVIPADPSTHLVLEGDTLYSIAFRYGIPFPQLVEVNQISNPEQIFPGTVLRIPPKEKPEIEVLGWIYHLGRQAHEIVDAASAGLTYLCPFTYLLDAQGGIGTLDDTDAIAAAYANGLVPTMCLANFTSETFGRDNTAHIVLNNPLLTATLIDNILLTVQEKGYLGVNLDFEAILSEDREAYNQFCWDLSVVLHRNGYFISSALPPKISGNQPGMLYEGFDYEVQGVIMDFIILMTYEWGYISGPAQAISPIDRIREVLDYAVTVIPKEKIFFGFEIYARDWGIPFVEGQRARTMSMEEAVLLASQYGATIRYQERSQSPYFIYQNENGQWREVWFEDARSTQAKFDLIKEYQLGGIGYWVLGYPFPENKALLMDNFTIKKLNV